MRKLNNLLILATLIVALFVVTAPAGAKVVNGVDWPPVNKDGERVDISGPKIDARSLSPYIVPPVDAKFVVGHASYTVNGKIYDMDAKTFIENGRTYVPIRYIAYALGVKEKCVTWDEPTKTVHLTRGYNVLKFRVGSKESNFFQTYWGYMPERWLKNPPNHEIEFSFVEGGHSDYLDKCYKMMDVAPVNRGGRVYLPARYVAEGFGVDVAWDNAARTVTLQQPQRKSSPFPPPAGLSTLGFKVGDKNAHVNCTVREEQKYEERIENGRKVSYNFKFHYIEGGAPLALSAAPFMDKDKFIYLPVVDTLKALGVPDENLSWDGQTLKVYMYPDYWFEIDAGSKLLKLNGFIMKNALVMREKYGEAVLIGSKMVNGAMMLDSYDLSEIYMILDDRYIVGGVGKLGRFQDENTGIAGFKN